MEREHIEGKERDMCDECRLKIHKSIGYRAQNDLVRGVVRKENEWDEKLCGKSKLGERYEEVLREDGIENNYVE